MSAQPEAENETLRVAVSRGDWPTALPILRQKALDAADQAVNWSNLGAALGAAGAPASRAHKRAVLLAPDEAGYLNDLGAGSDDGTAAARRLLVLDPLHGPAAVMSALQAFKGGGRAQAFRILRRLRLSQPAHLEATCLLAQTLDLAGRAEEAVPLYRAALCLDPEDSMGVRRDLARHGITPVREAFSQAYVAQVFNGYAENFDEHLRGRLKYTGPETLRELGLASGILSADRKARDAIDIGCGTGLSGAAVRAFCDRLTGIDIAAEMVRRAEDKGIYDRLLVGDAITLLAAESATYDLAIAVDVSSYIGDMKPFFETVSQRLAPGGALLMTAHEPAEPSTEGIGFGQDNAYSHSLAYLKETASAAGLALGEIRRGAMREEADRPLATFFLAFTKDKRPGK